MFSKISLEIGIDCGDKLSVATELLPNLLLPSGRPPWTSTPPAVSWLRAGMGHSLPLVSLPSSPSPFKRRLEVKVRSRVQLWLWRHLVLSALHRCQFNSVVSHKETDCHIKKLTVLVITPQPVSAPSGLRGSICLLQTPAAAFVTSQPLCGNQGRLSGTRRVGRETYLYGFPGPLPSLFPRKMDLCKVLLSVPL